MTEEKDRKMVDGAFGMLMQSYLASPHRRKVDLITKAFNFARQAHRGVRRLSGEPYIMHPLAVAQIASQEMGLGSTSICAALLHDVVEDTDYTVDDIANIFGEKIAMIVDGLTKISGGIFGDQASVQAENFKKLLLTMSDDIRVILIKICDRLHNMRTLESQPANKQYKIAGETLYIYAPLANRLGLNRIKTELEDLSFRYEHPQDYDLIEQKLSITEESREKLFNNFTAPIKKALDAMGVKYEIKARVKSPYSIWNKMKTKHVTFDEIYDILAVRIIFTPNDREEEINECFKIYVAISQIYKSHPDRLRDWLSHPKANGYQALHVTLMSGLGRWIEVQIRSDRMDEVAERGFAAHWKYKEDGGQVSKDDELNEWMNTIKEILDDPQPDAMDFLDAIKLNLYASEIFVFSPKGEIFTLPMGATALDFAFQIHTFIGTHCIGAKVNHQLVPLSHKLKGGDQVEILTSNSQRVQSSWQTFAVTAKAKNKIQALLRKQEREVRKLGDEILTDFLARYDLKPTPAIVETLCQYHAIPSADLLFKAMGDKTVILGENDISEILGKDKGGGSWRRYVPFMGKKSRKKPQKPAVVNPVLPAVTAPQAPSHPYHDKDKDRELIVVTKDLNRKKPVYISELNIHQYIFPSCCHCIPGDDALGFIDGHDHIAIHRRECHIANRLKASYGNRILDVKWDMHRRMFFDAKIKITGIDRLGLLNEITQVISRQLNVNIHTVSIVCDEGLFNGEFALRVHERDDVRTIITNLLKVNGVQEVQNTM